MDGLPKTKARRLKLAKAHVRKTTTDRVPAQLHSSSRNLKRQLWPDVQDSLRAKRLRRIQPGEEANAWGAFDRRESIELIPRPPTQCSPFQTSKSVESWLASIGPDSVGSDIERCWSESHLQLSDDNKLDSSISARSAPEMTSRDTDGFVVPPTPSVAGLQPSRPSSGSIAPSSSSGHTNGRNLAEDPFYRTMNLAENNIYLRSSRNTCPEHINDLVKLIRKNRASPGPSLEEVWRDESLEALGMGAADPDLEEYFRSTIFHYPRHSESFKRSDRQPMVKNAIPTLSKRKFSTPVPDILYGYSRSGALPKQQAQILSLGHDPVANSQDLICPFLAIESTGDGLGSTGNLWVATNQCIGGSTACVNILERLNQQLEALDDDTVHIMNSAAFSIAMTGSEARFHISWKEDANYYTMIVDIFLL